MKNRTGRYEKRYSPQGSDASHPYVLNRFFLFALFILMFNDFYLKTEIPSFVTGKLSDLSGLIVFVLFFTFLFGDRFKQLVFGVTVLLFCWWKSSLSTGFIENWNSVLSFYSIERVVDYSDLLCLFILVPVYFYQPKRTSFPQSRWFVLPVLLLTVFAISATSKARDIGAYNSTRHYTLKESFKIKKVTHAELLNYLSLSNLKVEKDPDAAPPEKPSDIHYYVLQNFEISDGLNVESMHIGVKEKNRNLKVIISDVSLYDPPQKTDKEVKEMLMELFEEFFSIGK